MRKVLQRCLICISCLSLVLLLLQYRGVVLPERDGSGSFDLHLHKYSVEESQSLRLRNDTEEGIRQACKSVIDGDRKTIKTLRQSNAFPWRDTTTDEQVSKIARNCTALKMRYRFPPYAATNATQEERDFPLAYTILANRYVNQILLLLSAVYREHNFHCVHFDAKSSRPSFLALKLAVGCLPNVFMSSARVVVTYAHVSRLEADIICMKDMLRLKEYTVKWKYLINMCSQDFPAKTNLEIVRSLRELNGSNSIQGHLDIDSATKRRTAFVHKVLTRYKSGKKVTGIRHTRKRHRPPPYNMTAVKNSAYNLYTRQFLQWALLDGPVGPGLLEWSRDTYSPDEHYWLMLNRHPDAPGGSLRLGDALARTVRWYTAKKTVECNGYWRHGICVFGAEDIHEVLKSKRLFINKFDVRSDSTGPVCIRRELDRRASSDSVGVNKRKDKNGFLDSPKPNMGS